MRAPGDLQDQAEPVARGLGAERLAPRVDDHAAVAPADDGGGHCQGDLVDEAAPARIVFRSLKAYVPARYSVTRGRRPPELHIVGVPPADTVSTSNPPLGSGRRPPRGRRVPRAATGKVSRQSKRCPGVPGDLVREPGRFPRRADTGPPHAGVAVHEHAELAARPAGRPAQARQQRGVVDGDTQVCPPEQRGEPLELGLADDVVRHEHIVDPGVDHHLGFVQGLARDSAGTERDLPPGDLDALVGLHVRPVRQTGPIAMVLPSCEVRLQPVQVDDQRRRKDVEGHAARLRRPPGAGPSRASKKSTSSTRGQSDTFASRSGADRVSLRATSLTGSPPLSAAQNT